MRAGPGVRLDTPRRLSTMSAMQATARNFTRKFPIYRRAARAGQTVRVRDRDGVTYVFSREEADAPSLADVAGHLLGSVNSGVRKKSLAGYHLAATPQIGCEAWRNTSRYRCYRLLIGFWE